MKNLVPSHNNLWAEDTWQELARFYKNETNMAEANKEYIRNTDWKLNNELEETMKCLVLRNFKRVKF